MPRGVEATRELPIQVGGPRGVLVGGPIIESRGVPMGGPRGEPVGVVKESAVGTKRRAEVHRVEVGTAASEGGGGCFGFHGKRFLRGLHSAAFSY